MESVRQSTAWRCRRTPARWRAYFARGLALSILGLALMDVAVAQSDVAATNAPSRRVRRRYDGRVQLYDLQETVPEPVPQKSNETDPNAGAPLSLGASDAPSLMLNSAVPGMPIKPRPHRAPEEEEEEESDDLWITSSVSAILGVEISTTNSYGSGRWGWLARDIRNSMATNRVARVAAPRREGEDTEEEANRDDRLREPPLITHPQTAGGQVVAPFTTADDPSRYAVQFRPEGSVTDSDLPRFGSERNALGGPSVNTSSTPPGAARTDAATPDYAEIRRRMDEVTAGHRPEATVQPSQPSSSELARMRLDAAADPAAVRNGVRMGPGPIDRPLLSGSPENYGRRGDIFSPSFRSSSLESGGLPPPAWGLSGGAGIGGASAPPPSTSLQQRPPSGFSGFDLMKPFDPAGRALTEPKSRW